jgi:hypothetical protein
MKHLVHPLQYHFITESPIVPRDSQPYQVTHTPCIFDSKQIAKQHKVVPTFTTYQEILAQPI